MAQDVSFDIVCKTNLQEVRNAVQMAQKELGTRFDFRGTSASVEWEESPPVLKLTGNHAAQLNSVREVLTSKLAKRGVVPHAFTWDAPASLPSGGMKQQAALQQGLSTETAKAITSFIKTLGLKVQSRIEGDAVRVSGRQRDDLQAVINAVKAKDFHVPLQMENYR